MSYILIFSITALLKFSVAFSEDKYLARHDPLFFYLTNREVLFLAALLESVTVVVLVSHGKAITKYAVVAWFSTVVAIYRLGLFGSGYHGSCGCLGNINGVLPISLKTQDGLTLFLLSYLIMSSYLLLYTQRKTLQLPGDFEHFR